MSEQPVRILHYWFGELDERGFAEPEKEGLWFKASDATDRYCQSEFGSQVEAAVAGRLDDWQVSDEGLMALVILLDQFTRNIYRGTAAAFSGDHAQNAVDSGRHLHMPAVHRSFLYLPYEHSEDLELQERGVALFDALVADFDDDKRLRSARRYAAAHRDVIAQFGRFPHRNAILNRDSSVEELAYLEKHGGF
jgi:uncharacterized protein (DUF924 family)